LITRRRFLAQSAFSASTLIAIAPALAAARADRPPTVDPALLEHARSLLEQAPLIDTHNDLPTMFIEMSGGDLTPFDLAVRQPMLCADLPSLREGMVGAQYWSVFVESATQKTHVSLHEALREFDVALRFIRGTAGFELARAADDIERITETGKIACLMGVEGGHMIENSPAGRSRSRGSHRSHSQGRRHRSHRDRSRLLSRRRDRYGNRARQCHAISLPVRGAVTTPFTLTRTS
jgi:membrane dipeptidase